MLFSFLQQLCRFKSQTIRYDILGAKYDVGGAAYNALSTRKVPISQDIVILNYWLGPDQATLKVAHKNYYRDGKDDEGYNKTHKILVSHIGTVHNIPNYQTTVYNFINNLKTIWSKWCPTTYQFYYVRFCLGK